jgi:uncharacterized Zn-binding protein involved in type VI secretion
MPAILTQADKSISVGETLNAEQTKVTANGVPVNCVGDRGTNPRPANIQTPIINPNITINGKPIIADGTVIVFTDGKQPTTDSMKASTAVNITIN